MTEQEFSYEVFDRQVNALINQGMMLVKGYDDMTTMELNLDLKSFYIKASKVCVMADIDFRLQHENFCRERAQQNIDFHKAMNLFVIGMLSPFINRVVARYQADERFEGVKAELYPYSISEVIPCLKEIPEINFEGIDNTIAATRLIELEMKKQEEARFPDIPHIERMWMLFQVYALMCYLMLHFIRMDELTQEKLDPEEGLQMLLAHLKRYAYSPEGSLELERYMESLRFDHDGVLTEPLLRAAQKELRKEVPQRLQLCFMKHIDDLDALVDDLAALGEIEMQEFSELIAAICKWQLLARELEELSRPQLTVEKLPNQVFCTMLHDKRIDLRELRERIKRMLPLVKQKNHWFCVWSVLRFRNLLATEKFETFAQQMMSAEWFGRESGVVSFSGDTLNECSGYFTDCLYTRWNEKDYQLYLATHPKKKWGTTLCQRFFRLCLLMDEEFRIATEE